MMHSFSQISPLRTINKQDTGIPATLGTTTNNHTTFWRMMLCNNFQFSFSLYITRIKFILSSANGLSFKDFCRVKWMRKLPCYTCQSCLRINRCVSQRKSPLYQPKNTMNLQDVLEDVLWKDGRLWVSRWICSKKLWLKTSDFKVPRIIKLL